MLNKRLLLGLAVLLTGASASFAASPMASDLSLIAPIINNYTALPSDYVFGSIVVDSTTGGFYGLVNNGTWEPLGVPANQSQISVDTSSTTGSTGYRVKVFTNVSLNTGGDITYTSDAGNGDTFTINTTGMYSISFSGNAGALDLMGITLNASITTGIGSLPTANVLAVSTTPAANYPANASWTGKLAVGSIIRGQQDGTTSSSTSPGLNHMTISRVY